MAATERLYTTDMFDGRDTPSLTQAFGLKIRRGEVPVAIVVPTEDVVIVPADLSSTEAEIAADQAYRTYLRVQTPIENHAAQEGLLCESTQ